MLQLLLLSCSSRVWLCVTPQTAAHQAPPSLGFSRQEHWNGLPFPSPMHESDKWKWSRSVVSDRCDPMDCSHQAPPSMGVSRQEYWPYDPAIPLLGIYIEETRIEIHTFTPMFISALFTIGRTWKQHRCPSADEWIRKLWYTVEYYSVIKKNTFESVLMRQMKLESIIQSEVSQK